MKFKNMIYNLMSDLIENIIAYAYIIAPSLFIIIYLILKETIHLNIDEEFNSNVINISGVLSGFLFSSLGIIMSLPDNKFTRALREYNYMEIIYKTMFIGIVSLIMTLILGLFKVLSSLKTILFIIGLSETLLSSYYIYKVTKLANKSSL